MKGDRAASAGLSIHIGSFMYPNDGPLDGFYIWATLLEEMEETGRFWQWASRGERATCLASFLGQTAWELTWSSTLASEQQYRKEEAIWHFEWYGEHHSNQLLWEKGW